MMSRATSPDSAVKKAENMTTTELPACGRCGSTALHHVVHGMPTHDMFEAEQPTNSHGS